MSIQRPFSQPLSSSSFLYGWKPNFNYLIGEINRYKIGLNRMETEYKDKMKAWEEQRTNIQQKEVAGNNVSTLWRYLDRDLERITYDRELAKGIVSNLFNRIETEANTLGGMIVDIFNDYESNYSDRITHAQLVNYLSDIKTLLSVGSNLLCFKKAPYDKAAEMINIHLPNKQTA